MAAWRSDERLGCYSVFGIAVDRRKTLKWLFPQEKATFHNPEKVYVYSENALIRPPRIVLHVVDLRVVLKRLQMRDDLRGHLQIERQPLFDLGRQPVGFAQLYAVGKQKVHLDDLPVAGGAEAHPVVLRRQVPAQRASSRARIWWPTAGSE